MITGSRFAENVLANKKNKLSLLTNCYFEIEKIMDIIPESFNPKPRVMSSMIRLRPKEVSNIEEKELIIFRFLFYFREKKLKNALTESLIKQAKINDKCLTQKETKKIIENLNIDLDLLEKEFMLFSNEELEYLFKKINLLN